MNSFIRFFASRHLVANIFTFMVLIIGIAAIFTNKRDLLPSVTLSTVNIATAYPGASPEDVELNITNKIEDRLDTVTGIEEITSLSAEGFSSIKVTIDSGFNEPAVAKTFQDIKDSIALINDFPSDLQSDPIIKRADTRGIPVIQIGLASDKLSYRKLREEAKKFEKKIENIPGVSRFDRFGFKKREIKIEVLPDNIIKYKIPLQDIITSIKNRNVRQSSGTIESYTSGEDIVTLSQFKNVKELEDIILSTTFEGPSVKLKQVPRVSDTFEDDKVIPRINGKTVISYLTYKKENADTVKTVAAIKQVVEKEKDLINRDINILLTNDTAKYVDSGYRVVANNGITGFILVVILLTLLLNLRVSIWVAIGIPVSILGALALMPAFGYYMNLISLSALILVLGIIVDDAIIIAESIYQKWEAGDTPLDAAVNGLRDVFWPVLTTVITTFLAFFPMFSIPGSVGKFVYVIPLIICLTISISMVEGVVALPAHMARSLKNAKVAVRHNYLAQINLYFKWILRGLLKFRYFMVAGFVVLLLTSVFLAATVMEVIFFPSNGADTFVLDIETPVGYPLKATEKVVTEAEKIVGSLPDSELVSFDTFVGIKERSIQQENYAFIRIFLTPFAERERDAIEISDSLRDKIKKIKGINRIAFTVTTSGPSQKKPISIKTVGSNDSSRKKLTDDIFSFLEKLNGVNDVERDDGKGKNQLRMKLDYNLLSRTGLSVNDVASNLRIAFKGQEVTKVQYGDEEVEFRLMMSKKSRQSREILDKIRIPNRRGQFVPLNLLAKFVPGPGPSSYRHLNGQRSTTIEANVEKSIISIKKVNSSVIERFNSKSDYPGVNIIIEGSAKNVGESMKQFLVTFTIAIIGIYLLLLLLFNSPWQPLMVMGAIPFGVTGVILAFLLHGQPLSFMALLGIVGLSGVVVNDSLVLVYTINGLKDTSSRDNFYRAIIDGAEIRLRPVLLTTVTTAAGLLPLAYGIGGDDPVNAPMALALGWGLLFATPLTLVLVPSLYAIGYDVRILMEKLAVYKSKIPFATKFLAKKD